MISCRPLLILPAQLLSNCCLAAGCRLLCCSLDESTSTSAYSINSGIYREQRTAEGVQDRISGILLFWLFGFLVFCFSFYFRTFFVSTIHRTRNRKIVPAGLRLSASFRLVSGPPPPLSPTSLWFRSAIFIPLDLPASPRSLSLMVPVSPQGSNHHGFPMRKGGQNALLQYVRRGKLVSRHPTPRYGAEGSINHHCVLSRNCRDRGSDSS